MDKNDLNASLNKTFQKAKALLHHAWQQSKDGEAGMMEAIRLMRRKFIRDHIAPSMEETAKKLEASCNEYIHWRRMRQEEFNDFLPVKWALHEMTVETQRGHLSSFGYLAFVAIKSRQQYFYHVGFDLIDRLDKDALPEALAHKGDAFVDTVKFYESSPTGHYELIAQAKTDEMQAIRRAILIVGKRTSEITNDVVPLLRRASRARTATMG